MHISNQLITQASLLLVEQQNFESVATLLSQATKCGNLAANHTLTQLYLNKKFSFCGKFNIAVKILMHCVGNGPIKPQYTPGQIYQYGVNVKIDLALTRYWYLEASEKII